jgi:error-prone DNA polymerase
MKYAELHCASAFSFLEGASQPEDLVDRAHHASGRRRATPESSRWSEQR